MYYKTFENFFLGEYNLEAYNLLKAAIRGKIELPIAIISRNDGVGLTHLLQAAYNEYKYTKNNVDLKAYYIEESCTANYPSFIKYDLLVIDDIKSLCVEAIETIANRYIEGKTTILGFASMEAYLDFKDRYRKYLESKGETSAIVLDATLKLPTLQDKIDITNALSSLHNIRIHKKTVLDIANDSASIKDILWNLDIDNEKSLPTLLNKTKHVFMEMKKFLIKHLFCNSLNLFAFGIIALLIVAAVVGPLHYMIYFEFESLGFTAAFYECFVDYFIIIFGVTFIPAAFRSRNILFFLSILLIPFVIVCKMGIIVI